MAALATVQARAHRRSPGLQLYASTQAEPRSRRPTDVALALASLSLLAVATAFAHVGVEVDVAVDDLVSSLPGLLDTLWVLLFWAPIVWAGWLLIASVARRRGALARDLVAASVLALVIAALTSALDSQDTWRGLEALFDTNGPPSYPALSSALAIAAISTAAPHLSRPFRHFGRWLVVGQLVATVFLGVSHVSGAFASIAVGLLASSLVHLAVGSPGGRPTVSRIQLALAGLGIDVRDLEPAVMQAQGIVRFEGVDDEGPLAVKVYGRDAWDGQLLATLWRSLWYREAQRTARLSRVELVEHEGFMTLLAERAGVRVPHLVAAGSAGRGDALVVVRPDGTLLASSLGAVEDAGIAALWADLDQLHASGVAHGCLDLDRLAERPDGSIGFADLSSAAIVDGRPDVLRDRAQALAVATLLVGADRTTAASRLAWGDDGVLEALPYLQTAGLPPLLRGALREADIDVDDVRAELREALGATEPSLIKLRRVTTGSLVNLALLAFAAYALIGLFSDMDMATFLEALKDANWWWLLFTLLVAQLTRVPAAVSTMGSIDHELPLGPLTALQFAICYINLAVPSTAARVAVNIRFFQRCGVKPAAAVSAGAIDGVAGFVVQVGLFLSLFFISDIDFGLSWSLDDLSGLGTLVLVVLVAAVVIAGLVVAFVRPVRTRVVQLVQQARTSLRVLRSPRKLVQLFGGNLVNQVMFAIALSASVYAFGAEVPLGEVILINTVVSLFAGLLPIPGGIGVTEAGLTYGLVAAGLDTETAFAAAVAYRFATFYLPPLWGYPCYRGLVKKRYL